MAMETRIGIEVNLKDKNIHTKPSKIQLWRSYIEIKLRISFTLSLFLILENVFK